jgi:undecaprenyl-diphosphatase
LGQLIETIILGIIQGLTEWLPISSTGHLKLFEKLLGFEARELVLFDVILHVGTLIVILVFFRKEVGKILSALARLDFKAEHGKIVPLIIVGVIPTALIGLIFGWLIEDFFQTILRIGIAFLFCGVMLYSAKFGKEKTESISYSTAIMIGIAQGIAIIPGISRSGATITVALLLGIKREKAFEFSFLLSIPAILGALGYTAYTEFSGLTSAGLEWSEILAGAIAAMLVGYFALKLLWKIIAKGKLHLFAFYCWLLGAVLVLSEIF